MAKVVSVVPKLLGGALGDTPSPAPVVLPTPSAKTDADPSVDDAITDPITARRRGRLGTIMTSFSGVLNDSSANTQRRTLLGE